MAQHSLQKSWQQKEDWFENSDGECNSLFGYGSFNVIGWTDPVINIRVEKVKFMLAHKFLDLGHFIMFIYFLCDLKLCRDAE